MRLHRADEARERAPQLTEERKWGDAIAACNTVLEQKTGDAPVWLWRATARRHLGAIEDRSSALKSALDDATESIRLDPSAPAFTEWVRNALFQLNDALADSEEAVRLAPGGPSRARGSGPRSRTS